MAEEIVVPPVIPGSRADGMASFARKQKTPDVIRNLSEIQALFNNEFTKEVTVTVNGSEQTKTVAELIVTDTANGGNLKQTILDRITEEYNKRESEIIKATSDITYKDSKFTVHVSLTFVVSLNKICAELCNKLEGKDSEVQEADEALTKAAKEYIKIQSGTTDCSDFTNAFNSFNKLLNGLIEPEDDTTDIAVPVEERGKAPAEGEGGEGEEGPLPGAESVDITGAIAETEAKINAAETAFIDAAATEANPAVTEAEKSSAQANKEEAIREASEAINGLPAEVDETIKSGFTTRLEALKPPVAEGGKKKALKKKGGANVGSLPEIYNAKDLVIDDHPPSGILGSPEQSMVQYSPASFSAGSMLSQDLAQGVAQPSQELLSPLSLQQVAGAKKKVLKKKKRSDSPKKAKK